MNKYQLNEEEISRCKWYAHSTAELCSLTLFKCNGHIFQVDCGYRHIWALVGHAWQSIFSVSNPSTKIISDKYQNVISTDVASVCLAWSQSDFITTIPISEFLYKTLDNSENDAK